MSEQPNIKMLDVVALLSDRPDENLSRGQVGAVVEMFHDSQVALVEFCDERGRTYALIEVRVEDLIVLHHAVPAA